MQRRLIPIVEAEISFRWRRCLRIDHFGVRLDAHGISSGISTAAGDCSSEPDTPAQGHTPEQRQLCSWGKCKRETRLGREYQQGQAAGHSPEYALNRANYAQSFKVGCFHVGFGTECSEHSCAGPWCARCAAATTEWRIGQRLLYTLEVHPGYLQSAGSSRSQPIPSQYRRFGYQPRLVRSMKGNVQHASVD